MIEPFNLMGIKDKCLVYFESSFGDRDLIYKNVRDSVVCFLFRYRYKIVSWTFLKKYKYFWAVFQKKCIFALVF